MSVARHRSVPNSLLLVVCSIVAAACSHGAHGAQDATPSTKQSTTPTTNPQGRAVLLCRAAAQRPSPELPIGPETYLNAQATTVAAVRGFRDLNGAVTLARAFPKASPTAFAAWCWSRVGPITSGQYVSYVMGPDGSEVVVVAEGSNSPPKPGAPILIN